MTMIGLSSRIIVGLGAILLTSAASALDFKGVSVGKRHSTEDVRTKVGVECGEGADGIQVCNGPVTIAAVRAEVNLVISKAGVVQRIYLWFQQDEYEAVRAALIAKFGKPSALDRSEVQNSFGAKFMNESLRWNGPTGTQLVAARFAGSRDTSSVYFSTPEDRAMLSGARPSERAKDL